MLLKQNKYESEFYKVRILEENEFNIPNFKPSMVTRGQLNVVDADIQLIESSLQQVEPLRSVYCWISLVDWTHRFTAMSIINVYDTALV